MEELEHAALPAAGTNKAHWNVEPAVLVVGDYRFADTFVAQAWERICGAYRQQSGEASFGDPPVPPRGMSPDPEALSPRRAIARERHPNLYPVPFSDLGDAARPDVARLLYRYLCHFDVWAIIACGTAANTTGLLANLSPLPVPVFVTVDSTVEKSRSYYNGRMARGSALRLMPNNDLQAQAILAKVAALVEREPDVDIQVFCNGEDDEYVRDLRKALEQHTREGPGRPHVRFVSDARHLRSGGRSGVVVCVGYYDALANLLGCGKSWRHVILSDGCFEERVRALIVGSDNGTDYYWSRPAFDHCEYAFDAYRAVNTVWRRIHAPRSHNAIQPLLTPFERRVRAVLERDRPTHYRFRGADNQRGGYLIEAVRSAEQLAIRIYDAPLIRTFNERVSNES